MRGVSLLFNLIKLFGITFHFVFSSRNVLQVIFKLLQMTTLFLMY